MIRHFKTLAMAMVCMAMVLCVSCKNNNDISDSGGDSTGVGKVTTVDKSFSISSSMSVYFSPGNLQYQPSTRQWRFAENQWDYVGDDNKNISSAKYSGWIDLFGWGTGNNPTNSSTKFRDYSSFSDWGNYCGLPTPEGTTGKWRTLTENEWRYVLSERTTSSGIRFAKAKVNNINGIIIVPDSWSVSTYSLNNTDDPSVDFEANVISASTWESVFEPAGCVFLPAAGYRDVSYVYHVGSNGYYWSSKPVDSGYACSLCFSSDNYIVGSSFRYCCRSVRLVAVSQN